MSETKKITAEQLETLLKNQKELNTVLVNIGVLESQKHSLLHQLADINKESEEFKAELQAQYGSININLEDGSYVAVEENVTETAKLDVV
jgi:vacuolar-type H+-ATPase subunit D/Vma8